mmetsp:Transcript_20845/g.37142  ORF Transcript_20845/g.37142 Transcript_20845/m.37142 type:complete len:234 (+) Transcript_20845:22-723(+)
MADHTPFAPASFASRRLFFCNPMPVFLLLLGAMLNLRCFPREEPLSLEKAFVGAERSSRTQVNFPPFSAKTQLCPNTLSATPRGRIVASAAAAAAKREPLAPPPKGLQAPIGVVLVDHGSRKKESNDMLVEFSKLYQKVSKRDIVEVAHMEIATPTIPQAIGLCVSRGARSVVIAPYFLSNGRHIQSDIPAIVEDARTQYPELTIRLAAPMGIDEQIARVIEDRVKTEIHKEE